MLSSTLVLDKSYHIGLVWDLNNCQWHPESFLRNGSRCPAPSIRQSSIFNAGSLILNLGDSDSMLRYGMIICIEITVINSNPCMRLYSFLISLLFSYLLLVDVIPLLCERAGLPQKTPLAMFEVGKLTLTRILPSFCPHSLSWLQEKWAPCLLQKYKTECVDFLHQQHAKALNS